MTSPEMLRDQLFVFVDELRRRGFNIGVTQFVSVHELLVRLVAQGTIAGDPNRLRSFLAPILCSSPKEQTDFDELFEEWLPRLAPAMGMEWAPAQLDPSAKRNDVTSELERMSRANRTWKWAIAAAVAALIVPSGIFFYRSAGKPSQVVESQPSEAETEDDAVGSPSDDQLADASASIEDELGGRGDDTEALDSEEESEALADRRRSERRQREESGDQDEAHVLSDDAGQEDSPADQHDVAGTEAHSQSQSVLFRYAVGAIANIVSLFVLRELWMRRRARMYLSSRAVSGPVEIQHLAAEKMSGSLFRRVSLFRTLQEFRKHRRVLSDDIDIVATAERTAANCGLFSPVPKHRQVSPEYLVLIDRRNYRDQQAKLIDELANRMAEHDIALTKYYFDRDPRICAPSNRHEAPRSLEELASRHSSNRLLVFSSVSDFTSPVTGKVQPWLERFNPWSDKAILTFEAAERFSHVEDRICDAGFEILPATEEGMDSLIQRWSSEIPLESRRQDDRLTPPNMLRDRPRLWLDRHPPDATTLQRLLQQVRAYLGDAGYQWFSACAVYPALNWNLTVNLGHHLKTDADERLLSETRLTRLTQLPWFRFGSLPTWLRSRLLDDMPKPQAAATRQAIQGMLLTALEQPQNRFHLDIAKFKRGLSALAGRVLRSMSRTAPEYSPMRDHVFVSFMEDRLAFRLPAAIGRTLRNVALLNLDGVWTSSKRKIQGVAKWVFEKLSVVGGVLRSAAASIYHQMRRSAVRTAAVVITIGSVSTWNHYITPATPIHLDFIWFALLWWAPAILVSVIICRRKKRKIAIALPIAIGTIVGIPISYFAVNLLLSPWMETAIPYLLAAVLLMGFTLWWIMRRPERRNIVARAVVLIAAISCPNVLVYLLKRSLLPKSPLFILILTVAALCCIVVMFSAIVCTMRKRRIAIAFPLAITAVMSVVVLTVWVPFSPGFSWQREVEFVRAFEHKELRNALVDISEALRDNKPWPAGPAETNLHGEDYLRALEHYVTWYGCGESASADQVTYDGFAAMWKIVSTGQSALKNQSGFPEQAQTYFKIVKDQGDDWKSPARLLRGEDSTDKERRIDARNTILAGLTGAIRYLSGYATLNSNHPNEKVREWMRVQEKCGAIERTYRDMLDAAGDLSDIGDTGELEEFRKSFAGNFDEFDRAVKGLQWTVGGIATILEIPDLRSLLLNERQVWMDYQETLSKAFDACETTGDESFTELSKAIASLADGDNARGMVGLDPMFWESLRKAELTDKTFHKEYLASEEKLRTAVEEVYDRYSYIFTKSSQYPSANDALVRDVAIGTISAKLTEVAKNLADAGLRARLVAGVPSEWISEMEALLDAADEAFDRDGGDSTLASLPEVWRPDDLDRLYTQHKGVIRRGKGRNLLQTIEGALADASHMPWGMAELLDNFNTPQNSPYYIPTPSSADRSDRRRSESDEIKDAPVPKKKRRSRPSRRRPSRGASRTDRGGQAESTRPTPERRRFSQGDQKLPACATHDFLSERATECADLLYFLNIFDESMYLRAPDDDGDLNRVCMDKIEEAGKAYFRTYVEEWNKAYEDHKLEELKRIHERATDWKTMAEALKGSASKARHAIAEETTRSLSTMFSALPYWDYRIDGNEWTLPDYEEWRTVESWMQAAIADNWHSGGFMGTTQLLTEELSNDNRRKAPWDGLAAEFADRWDRLALAIIKNAALPALNAFDRERQRRKKEQSIPWGQIKALREAARLEDEKLTAQLVEFEEQAQRLLSVEITNTLVQLQDKYFPSKTPWDGWPYLRNSNEPLDTVDFDSFTKFLRSVANVRKYFEYLEEQLPDTDELARRRREFYDLCGAWQAFMGVKEGDADPESLIFEVVGSDPLARNQQMPPGMKKPDDTPQHFYNTVALDLKCEVETDTGFVMGTVDVPTLRAKWRERQKKAQWKWPKGVANQTLSFAFTDGRRPACANKDFPTVQESLGHASPLALCAYLHRHATGKGTVWTATHTVNLPDKLATKGDNDLVSCVKQTGNVFGLSFTFTLERSMPNPIAPLERTN